MEFEQIKQLVDDHIDLIALGPKAHKEALDRTTRFLIVIALLADYKLELERRKAKVATMRDAFYSHAVTTAEGKNVTEKKVQAESNKQYTDQRESVEEIDAEMWWLKTHIDMFNNAHLTYRTMAKGE